MRSVGHVVHSGPFGVQNGDAPFFMLRWEQYGFDKKFIGAHYAKTVFLHPVRSAGHVVLSSASEA
jgi:hypothetical protein